MLTLPIKKHWFDMINFDIKKAEYRDISPYYDSRLKRYLYNYIELVLQNGYSKDSPKMRCVCFVTIGCGIPEWGAIPKQNCYILLIKSHELI